MQKNLSKTTSNVMPRNTLIRSSTKNSVLLEEKYFKGVEERKSMFKEEPGKPYSKSIHELMEDEDDMKNNLMNLEKEKIAKQEKEIGKDNLDELYNEGEISLNNENKNYNEEIINNI